MGKKILNASSQSRSLKEKNWGGQVPGRNQLARKMHILGWMKIRRFSRVRLSRSGGNPRRADKKRFLDSELKVGWRAKRTPRGRETGCV